jgi:hypothetical protein
LQSPPLVKMCFTFTPKHIFLASCALAFHI